MSWQVFQNAWKNSRSETSWRKSIVGSKGDNPSSEKNSRRSKRRLPVHPGLPHNTAAAQEPSASGQALDTALVKATPSDWFFLTNEYSSSASQQSRRRQQRINFSVISVSFCSILCNPAVFYSAKLTDTCGPGSSVQAYLALRLLRDSQHPGFDVPSAVPMNKRHCCAVEQKLAAALL